VLLLVVGWTSFVAGGGSAILIVLLIGAPNLGVLVVHLLLIMVVLLDLVVLV